MGSGYYQEKDKEDGRKSQRKRKGEIRGAENSGGIGGQTADQGGAKRPGHFFCGGFRDRFALVDGLHLLPERGPSSTGKELPWFDNRSFAGYTFY